jgi:hypothetical protein
VLADYREYMPHCLNKTGQRPNQTRIQHEHDTPCGIGAQARAKALLECQHACQIALTVNKKLRADPDQAAARAIRRDIASNRSHAVPAVRQAMLCFWHASMSPPPSSTGIEHYRRARCLTSSSKCLNVVPSGLDNVAFVLE